jgi:hypothetical protein
MSGKDFTMRCIKKIWMVSGGIVAALTVAAVLAAGAAVAGTTTASKEKAATLSGSSVGYPTTSISGTFEGKLGQGTYAGTLTLGPTYVNSGDLCSGPICQDVQGTITFSAKNGDFTASVQPGGVVGTDSTPHITQQIYELSLDVESGTQAYAHAKGELTLNYTSDTHFDDFGEITFVEDSGTLTGNPR